MSRFSYRLNSEDFVPFGEPYPLTWGHYRGDRIGIYCFNDETEAGYIDVDAFHYEVSRFPACFF